MLNSNVQRLGYFGHIHKYIYVLKRKDVSAHEIQKGSIQQMCFVVTI
jgi:hypothetical protein